MKYRLFILSSGNLLLRTYRETAYDAFLVTNYYLYYGIHYGGKPVRYCWRAYRIDVDEVAKAYHGGPALSFENLHYRLKGLVSLIVS